METTGRVPVAAVQMEPKLGRLDENLERIVERLERGGRGRGAASSSSPSAPSRVTDSPVARRGWRMPSRSTARRCARSSRPASDHRCFCIFGLLERDGARLFNACVLTGPDGVVGTYRKVHLPFLGIDMFVDPGRPAVRRPRRGRPPGRDAHLLRRLVSRDRPRPVAAGCRSPGPADQLADAFGVRRRAHDPDPRDGEHRLRDGGQPRGRGERIPIHRLELDRRPERPRAGPGRRRLRGDPHGRDRPGPARGRSTWSASRAGTRSTGSPIAGRGSTTSWSRPTGGNERPRIKGEPNPTTRARATAVRVEAGSRRGPSTTSG